MRACRLGVILPLMATGACASLPRGYTAACPDIAAPAITYSADGKTAGITLDVLTYNIEGLGWPARKNRGPYLQRIGRHLAALREAGTAPDIVLFQEMFSKPASQAVLSAGYPALVAGPARTQRRELAAGGTVEGRRKWKKGEIGVHFATGGLAIVSRYPIILDQAEPFSKTSCGGFDCLSNKGVLFARIAIPGVPEPIDLYNTHMNSQRSSKVSVERRNSAHAVQARELGNFIDAVGNAGNPAILAGDFNMRGSDERHLAFRPGAQFTLVHQYCLQREGACDIGLSWDGDAPWMDTQDLQYFAPGSRVSVRPRRVDAMFDGRPDSPMLSDHDGFRVVYEVRWPVDTPAVGGPCPQ